MKKIALLIALTTSACTQTGGFWSQPEPEPKSITGFIRLNPDICPEIAGFPEKSPLPEYSTKTQLEKALGKEITPQTILFPVRAWNSDNKQDFAHLNKLTNEGIIFPPSLDFETIKTKNDNDELTLKIGFVTFILTVQQPSEFFQDSFQEVLKQQVNRALGFQLNYGANEREKLIEEGILEKGILHSYLLTEKHRKPLEDFLKENK
ncbi:MAG: hypothetical protein AB7R69_03060 [Candidatus Babeliales bacterium]